MKKQPSPFKSLVTIVVAGAAGLAIGYAAVNAYINKTSMQNAAVAVNAIEPASGMQDQAVIHPTVNAADAGATDAVQGTVDSTAAH
jgi:hypothetical protein